MKYRSELELAAAIDRQIISLGRRVGQGDPADLQHLNHLRATLSEAREIAVRGLQRSGHHDADIAAQLGVTRTYLSRTYPMPGRRGGAGIHGTFVHQSSSTEGKSL